jgi:ABC-type multidrug transport system fused ATPase/permease subunit
MFTRPKKSLILNVAIINVCILTNRVLNTLAPRQLGIVINKLHEVYGVSSSQAPYNWGTWPQVGLYLLYEWLRSASSPINIVQRICWIPITQHNFKTISNLAHAHIMKLSYDFHSSEESSQLYSAINRGRTINNLIETIGFHMVPSAIDLVVAGCYLSYSLGVDMLFGLIVISITCYKMEAKFRASLTILWRKHFSASDKGFRRLVESVGGWHTVSVSKICSQRYTIAYQSHILVLQPDGR